MSLETENLRTAIKTGLITASILGVAGALGFGIAACLYTGTLAAGVTAGVWGASVLGLGGTAVAGLTVGLLNQTKSCAAAALAAGLATTVALACGVAGMHAPEQPAKKFAAARVTALFSQSAAKTETNTIVAPTTAKISPVRSFARA